MAGYGDSSYSPSSCLPQEHLVLTYCMASLYKYSIHLLQLQPGAPTWCSRVLPSGALQSDTTVFLHIYISGAKLGKCLLSHPCPSSSSFHLDLEPAISSPCPLLGSLSLHCADLFPGMNTWAVESHSPFMLSPPSPFSATQTSMWMDV